MCELLYTHMSPSDAWLVVWIDVVLALRCPGIGRGELLSLPLNPAIRQQVGFTVHALWCKVCIHYNNNNNITLGLSKWTQYSRIVHTLFFLIQLCTYQCIAPPTPLLAKGGDLISFWPLNMPRIRGIWSIFATYRVKMYSPKGVIWS